MANPPITIGPFNNVPAPGSPIASAWPQQLTQYAVDLKARVDGIRIRSGSNVPTTNGSGVANIAFGYTFPGPPIVIVTNGNDTQRVSFSLLDDVTSAAFNVVARNLTDGAAFAGQLIKVNWVAVYGAIVLAAEASA